MWDMRLGTVERIYGDVVRRGVEAAYIRHLEIGGEGACIRIVDLVEVVVDTRPDAIQCATALATWKALGHDESEATVEYRNGWEVSFA